MRPKTSQSSTCALNRSGAWNPRPVPASASGLIVPPALGGGPPSVSCACAATPAPCAATIVPTAAPMKSRLFIPDPATSGAGQASGCRAPASPVRPLRPRGPLVVRRLVECRDDGGEAAVLHLEHLEETPCLRLLKHRFGLGSIRQEVLVEHALVIDEAARHRHLPSLVDEHDFAPNAVVEGVPPRAEAAA